MKLLIVDDEPGLRQSLRLLLTEEGFDVAEAPDGEHALERALREPFDVVLCDVRMPVMDGLEFLRRYRSAGGPALVIMMSAYGSEDSAIAAMKEGAYDYVQKPFRADEVVLVLRKAEERERLRREVESLRSALGSGAASRDIVAASQAMRSALDIVAKVAPHTTTVLITGPSGTGKEVLARELHRLSPRADGPFVAVNCAAIPEALLESQRRHTMAAAGARPRHLRSDGLCGGSAPRRRAQPGVQCGRQRTKLPRPGNRGNRGRGVSGVSANVW